MARTKDVALIHGAAFFFSYVSRDRSKIADHFDVSERTIERWSKLPEWHEALNVWGYTGDRDFIRKPRRDIAYSSRERFDQAKAIYIDAFKSGSPLHSLATITGEATKLPASTIRRWANRYHWKTYLEEAGSEDIAVVEFMGISKTKYPFETHILGTEFPSVGAVYVFTKGIKTDRGISHEALYVDEVEPLVDRFCHGRIFNCVRLQGGNFICIHREKDTYLRRKIVSDLIPTLKPICNEQFFTELSY